ncbi:hypothetical protein NQZ68_034217 [Dissostichus eleginoides]|nr:hypothetical protein NQZ68_034217 [Dissostichus eleginoides]
METPPPDRQMGKHTKRHDHSLSPCRRLIHLHTSSLESHIHPSLLLMESKGEEGGGSVRLIYFVVMANPRSLAISPTEETAADQMIDQNWLEEIGPKATAMLNKPLITTTSNVQQAGRTPPATATNPRVSTPHNIIWLLPGPNQNSWHDEPSLNLMASLRKTHRLLKIANDALVDLPAPSNISV